MRERESERRENREERKGSGLPVGQIIFCTQDLPPTDSNKVCTSAHQEVLTSLLCLFVYFSDKKRRTNSGRTYILSSRY